MNESALGELYLQYLKAKLHPENGQEAIFDFENAVRVETNGTMTVSEWQVAHELEMQEELKKLKSMLEQQPRGIQIIGTVK